MSAHVLEQLTAEGGLTEAVGGLRVHVTSGAYVSKRQQTSANVSKRQQTSANVSIRQHTSANVSKRQHTSAHVTRLRVHVTRGFGGSPERMPATSLFGANIHQKTSQYLYFCTSTASKLSTCLMEPVYTNELSPSRPSKLKMSSLLPAYVSIRQHTSAYTSSVRPHTLLVYAAVSI
jgi:hypothetical protein